MQSARAKAKPESARGRPLHRAIAADSGPSPAGRVAAKRAQSHALAGRVAAARIGTPEKLDARDVLENLVEDMARGLGDRPRTNAFDAMDALAGMSSKPLRSDAVESMQIPKRDAQNKSKLKRG